MNLANSNEQSYFYQVFNASPCAMLISNCDGFVEQANQQALELLDCKKETVIGKNIEQLITPKDTAVYYENVNQLVNNSKQSKAQVIEIIAYIAKDKQKKSVKLSLTSVDNNGDKKIVVSIIKQQKYVELSNKLEKSQQELDDFIYVASHDLKAPMRGIVQLSDWIIEDVEPFANDEIKENLSLLKSRTLRLNGLLEGLLAYSRVGSIEDSIKLVNTKELVNSIFQSIKTDKSFELICDENLPNFKTHATHIEIVFTHLIDNAIKHHHKPKGIIKIGCQLVNNRYIFSVASDGPDIDLKYHKKIFELFKTLKPRDEVEGSGMGLSIVKKILDNLEQSIEVKSDNKLGTAFLFSWAK